MHSHIKVLSSSQYEVWVYCFRKKENNRDPILQLHIFLSAAVGILLAVIVQYYIVWSKKLHLKILELVTLLERKLSKGNEKKC